MKELVADLPRQWPRLAGKPVGERRVAVVLDSAEDAAVAAALLDELAAVGYRTGGSDGGADAIADRLRQLPGPHLPRAPAEETLSFADYSASFAGLPPRVQQQLVRRWGAAERDPLFRSGELDCGRFAIAGFRSGLVALLLQPGDAPLDLATIGEADDSLPSHSHLALCCWLESDFRADVVIDLRHPSGKDASGCRRG